MIKRGERKQIINYSKVLCVVKLFFYLEAERYSGKSVCSTVKHTEVWTTSWTNGHLPTRQSAHRGLPGQQVPLTTQSNSVLSEQPLQLYRSHQCGAWCSNLHCFAFLRTMHCYDIKVHINCLLSGSLTVNSLRINFATSFMFSAQKTTCLYNWCVTGRRVLDICMNK